uniref:Uncharacterized protein n=1 Tax=Arundo donax TaxID=35708 RepID=A0A0A8XR31_ARUDO
MSEKDEELTNLKKKNTIIENRNIEVEQINTDDRIDHINRLLEAEKLNSRILNEQLVKAVNEKHKLMTELKTYNDGLTRIQGFIHRSLTSRLSLLRHIATTIKLGYYEDLLARINALGQVKEHLPKLWGTIEIATSLSAYIPVAAMFVRLRAYHGDDFIFKVWPCLLISAIKIMLGF